MARKFIFKQDGNPKHKAKIIRKWLKETKINTLDWVTQSLDLNPVENLWLALKRRIAEPKPSNLVSLKVVITEEWANIGQNVTKGLVESMSRRIQAGIAANGGHTKYRRG